MTTPQFDVIDLHMQMHCAAGTGAQHVADLRTAAARRWPDLIRVTTGIDSNGNPITADDPNGVIERATVLHWFLDLLSLDAQQQAMVAAKAGVAAAMASITTSVTINSTPVVS